MRTSRKVHHSAREGEDHLPDILPDACRAARLLVKAQRYTELVSGLEASSIETGGVGHILVVTHLLEQVALVV
jgi:hypothetical protein